MKKSFAELFAVANGGPINVEGQQVFNIYRRNVKNGQAVSIHILKHANQPDQGLRLKIVGGTLLVNGQELEDVVLWLDTAPADVEIACCIAKPSTHGELRIWNCWRSDTGTTQAWIGNAGMIVEEERDGATLRCSSGTGLFDPTQLTVNIQIH